MLNSAVVLAVGRHSDQLVAHIGDGSAFGITAEFAMEPEPLGTGGAAALASLAMGHHASVAHHSDQMRWRFSSGVSFGTSIFQVVVMCATAAAVHAMPLLMVLCAGGYAWSTWWYGRVLTG